MKINKVVFNFLFLFGDVLAIVTAFLSTYLLRQSLIVQEVLGFITEASNYLSFYDFNLFTIKSAGLFVVLMFLLGGYKFSLKDRFKVHLSYLLRAIVLWGSFAMLYFLLIRTFPFSRSVFLASIILAFVLIAVFRFFVLKLKIRFYSLPANRLRLLLVATDKKVLANFYTQVIKDGRFEVVAYVCPEKINKLSLRRFTDFSSFLVSKMRVDRIVDLDYLAKFDKNRIMAYCRFNQVDYTFVPIISDFLDLNFEYDLEHNFMKLNLVPSSLNGWHLVLKRFFDIVVSSFLLIVLFPFLLLVAILIKLDSKGPVFFVKDDKGDSIYRLGKNKELFVMYKFRTMQSKSHSMRYKELAAKDFRDGSPLVKIKNDPRITKLGKILRRFDIDELPQLWNVLLGDMSLVGPRPHLQEEVLKYKDHHNFVFTIKPGITGISQTSGRSDLSFEDEVRLDTYYIQNWNVFLDLKILLKTPFVVFLSHGENSKVAKKTT